MAVRRQHCRFLRRYASTFDALFGGSGGAESGKSNVRRFQTRRLSPHAAQDLFSVVCDIESYPNFVPYCNEAFVLQHNKTSDGRFEILADLQVRHRGTGSGVWCGSQAHKTVFCAVSDRLVQSCCQKDTSRSSPPFLTIRSLPASQHLKQLY